MRLACKGMEKSSNMTMEELGGRVASVWAGLRPTTRSLFERALQSAANAPAVRSAHAYDARAEWELSRLLAALDDRAHERGARSLSLEQTRELGRLAETCALVLHAEARSAEVSRSCSSGLSAHTITRAWIRSPIRWRRVCRRVRFANWPAIRIWPCARSRSNRWRKLRPQRSSNCLAIRLMPKWRATRSPRKPTTTAQ